MEPSESTKVKPQIHDLSMFKQIMESRSHPLDMLREALSNMMAPEVNANKIEIQHFSHPDYDSSFILKDDGVGMTYSGDPENPGRLDRFIGLAFSKSAGLKADYWGWKGLGSKLMLNCNNLKLESWTGNQEDNYITLEIANPRNSLLQEPPTAPDYYLTKRSSNHNDRKGTRIEIFGYDGGKKNYSFSEISHYLYWNSALGITKDIPHKPIIELKVGSEHDELGIGFKYLHEQLLENGTKDWKTVVINGSIKKEEDVNIDSKIVKVTVALKGGFTLNTGAFGLSPHRYNTGLRLSIKGIPFFQLPFYEYKGNKFAQYKDLCCFVIECDEVESKLNLDRSNLSNQLGEDQIVKVFKRLTAKCFDELSQSIDYIEYEKNRKKEDERNKAKAVRDRQNELMNPNQEYVCINGEGNIKILHRVPNNSEMHTLVIFWKLEALDLLPFENFITWEHTSREGIDVIASFQIDDESSLENFVPIEFEYKFENFIAHGHNPKQTKCIICWTIAGSTKLRRVSEYLYFYEIDSVSIPVYEISSFPNIIIKKYNEIS